MIDLDKQSVRINIYLFGTLMVGLASCVFWLSNTLNNINAQQSKTQDAIAALQELIATKTADQMTKTDAAEEALRNALLNPGVRFSDPRNPGQSIVVESGRITKQ